MSKKTMDQRIFVTAVPNSSKDTFLVSKLPKSALAIKEAASVFVNDLADKCGKVSWECLELSNGGFFLKPTIHDSLMDTENRLTIEDILRIELTLTVLKKTFEKTKDEDVPKMTEKFYAFLRQLFIEAEENITIQQPSIIFGGLMTH